MCLSDRSTSTGALSDRSTFTSIDAHVTDLHHCFFGGLVVVCGRGCLQELKLSPPLSFQLFIPTLYCWFPRCCCFYYSCLALLFSCSYLVLFTPTLCCSLPPCVVVATLHCSLPPYIVVPTLRYYYLLPPCIIVARLGCYDSSWVVIACCCSPYVVNARLRPMLLLFALGYYCSPCVAYCSPSSCVVVCLKLLLLALG